MPRPTRPDNLDALINDEVAAYLTALEEWIAEVAVTAGMPFPDKIDVTETYGTIEKHAIFNKE